MQIRIKKAMLTMFNFMGFIFILGIIGAFENFQEISIARWIITIALLIIFYIETIPKGARINENGRANKKRIKKAHCTQTIDYE